MFSQYGELRPTSGWDRSGSLGYPYEFQWVFSHLGSITARHLVVGISQTLWSWTEGATYVRQGNHHVGNWPTFLLAFININVVLNRSIRQRTDVKGASVFSRWRKCIRYWYQSAWYWCRWRSGVKGFWNPSRWSQLMCQGRIRFSGAVLCQWCPSVLRYGWFDVRYGIWEEQLLACKNLV